MTTNSAKRIVAALAGLLMVGAIAAVPAVAATSSDKATDQKAAAVEVAADEKQAEGEEAEESHELPATNDWYEATDCSTCHSKQVDTFENEKCLASTHAAFLECSGCHNVDDLAPVHEGVTDKDRAPSALKKTEFDVEASCTKCHQVDTLAEATKDCEYLTDENGLTVNPHDIPAVPDHEAEITCVDCHKVHSKTGIEKNASRACTSCHHTNVYECYTCHA